MPAPPPRESGPVSRHRADDGPFRKVSTRPWVGMVARGLQAPLFARICQIEHDQRGLVAGQCHDWPGARMQVPSEVMGVSNEF